MNLNDLKKFFGLHEKSFVPNVGIGTTNPGTSLDVAGAITSRPFGTSSGNTGQLTLRELAANGTNTATIRSPDTLAADYVLTLPVDDGTSGQVLQTNGSGVLSWAAAGGTGDFKADGSVAMTGSLNAGGQNITGLALGSAAAPSLSFTGDTNTGLFSSGPDSLSLSTAGTERMLISSTGNVGIGGSASYNLQIDGTNTDVQAYIRNKSSSASRYPGLTLRNYNGGTAGYPLVDFGNYGGTSAATTATATNAKIGGMVFKAYTTQSEQLAFIGAMTGPNFSAGDLEGEIVFETRNAAEGSPSEKMRINNSGNVGIGTQTPRATLDVNGAIISAPAVVDTAGTINFANSNFAYTASSCGAFVLENMKNGATYTLAIQGTTSATCSFTAYPGLTAGGSPHTVKLPPSHTATTATKQTLYSFVVIGTTVYVAWVPGY